MIRKSRLGALLVVFSLLAHAQGVSTYKDLMKQGEDLRAGGQWEKAIERYREAAGRAGDVKQTARAEYRVAQMYEELHDVDAALDWYRTSEKSTPYDETEAAIKRLEIAQSGHIASAEEIKRSLLAKTRSQRVQPSLELYVRFDTDKDTLTTDGETQVATLGEALKDVAFSNDRFALVGHTDKRGTDQHNQDLSERRAHRVLLVLHEKFGFENSRFDLIGMGKRQLLASGDTEEDHQVNRRVEIKRLSGGK